MRRLLVLPLALLWVGRVSAADMNGYAVSDGSGPVSELSAGIGGAPVHEPGRSVRDGSSDRLSNGSVQGSVTGTVSSGSVSEASEGPVATSNGLTPDEAAAASAIRSALIIQLTAPQGVAAIQPLQGLGQLADELRNVQPLPRDATEFDAAQPSIPADANAEAPAASDQPASETAAVPDDAAAPPTDAPAVAQPGEAESAASGDSVAPVDDLGSADATDE